MLYNIYIFCFMIGCIYAVISFFLTFVSNIFDLGLITDLPGALDVFSFLPSKPFLIVAFLTVFGGSGLVFLEIDFITASNILLGVTFFISVFLGYTVAKSINKYIYMPLSKAQTQVKKQSAAIGLKATVSQSILPSKYGRISYVVEGNILSAPAKEMFDGNGYKKGEEVIITKIQDNIFYVSKESGNVN